MIPISLGTSILPIFEPSFQVQSRKYRTFQNKNIDPEYRGGGDDDDEHYAFSVAEAIFVGWFTFEYIIRFVAAPQKWR